MNSNQAQKFMEVESQSIASRYRPTADARISLLYGWDTRNDRHNRIIDQCKVFGAFEFDSAALSEEQERELSPETEAEREVEQPEPAKSEKHTVRPDVKRFVLTGKLPASSRAFQPAFETLDSTSAARRLEVSQFPRELLVTRDFASTVVVHGNDYVSDAYQRPVRWVLTSSDGADSETTKDMVIISPFEADNLLPDIERYKKVTIHPYAPRPDMSFQPLDRLDLITLGKKFKSSLTPRNLILQLNLFAGQLCLHSFGEYKELCDFLGLAWEVAKDGEEIGVDGFITPSPAKETGFKQSPVSFLKILLTKIRRDCGKIDKTHLGRILNGERLKESDFRTDGRLLRHGL